MSAIDAQPSAPNEDTSASELPTQDSAEAQSPNISKRQLKKAAKRAAYEAAKPERRAKEKAAKKAKALHKRAHPEEYPEEERANTNNKRRKAAVALGKRPEFRTTLLLDLGGWDDKMSEKEIISLTSQLCYCYNIARHAEHRFKFLVAHWTGRVQHRMSPEGPLRGQYESWSKQADVQLESQSLEKLLESGQVDRSRVVYLTADSPRVLSQVDEDQVYVLGGIVDKNRYKNLCLSRAEELGVQHAQLPIGQYVDHMPSRKVLTVNHVFDILTRWMSCKDWEEAFYQVIPQRKFYEPPDFRKDTLTTEVDESVEEPQQPSPNAPAQLHEQGRDLSAEAQVPDAQ